MNDYKLLNQTFMVPYTKEVADFCDPFCCGDKDLDDFFHDDVFLGQ
jgi:hypothetical protein